MRSAALLAFVAALAIGAPAQARNTGHSRGHGGHRGAGMPHGHGAPHGGGSSAGAGGDRALMNAYLKDSQSDDPVAALLGGSGKHSKSPY